MSDKTSLIRKAKAEVSAIRLLNVPPVVATAEEYDKARELFKELRKRHKEIEAKRDAILTPLKTSMQEVKTLFAPVLETSEQAMTSLQKSLTEYANQAEARRREELARINDDKRLKNPETIQKLRDAVSDRPEGTMKVMELVIDDESKIPAEFWVVDTVALRRALVAGRIVKGARLKESLTVTAR